MGVLLNQKTSFVVTPKSQQQGNFVYLVIPHFIYIAIAAVGLGVGLVREGVSASLIANFSWVAVNIVIFLPFIRASLPEKLFSKKTKTNRAKPVVTGTIIGTK